MTAPQIYVSFPGTAREALGFYADVFGGELSLHTYVDFSRSDGPPDAIAHGMLNGVVALAGSDAAAGEKSVRLEGVMLSLLGTEEPAVLHEWFDKLTVGGQDFTGSSDTNLSRERRTASRAVSQQRPSCALRAANAAAEPGSLPAVTAQGGRLHVSSGRSW